MTQDSPISETEFPFSSFVDAKSHKDLVIEVIRGLFKPQTFSLVQKVQPGGPGSYYADLSTLRFKGNGFRIDGEFLPDFEVLPPEAISTFHERLGAQTIFTVPQGADSNFSALVFRVRLRVGFDCEGNLCGVYLFGEIFGEERAASTEFRELTIRALTVRMLEDPLVLLYEVLAGTFCSNAFHSNKKNGLAHELRNTLIDFHQDQINQLKAAQAENFQSFVSDKLRKLPRAPSRNS